MIIKIDIRYCSELPATRLFTLAIQVALIYKLITYQLEQIMELIFQDRLVIEQIFDGTAHSARMMKVSLKERKTQLMCLSENLVKLRRVSEDF